jgi:uncharacterized spore protein YtfJ
MTSSDTAVLDTIRDAIGDAGANRAFGEPLSRDGVTVLPAAKVSGGGGGGGGSGEGNPQATEGKKVNAAGRGNGGGFGVTTRPVGAYVIKNGSVTWRPAVDATKVILGAQAVAIAALMTVRTIVWARSRRSSMAMSQRRALQAMRMLRAMRSHG